MKKVNKLLQQSVYIGPKNIELFLRPFFKKKDVAGQVIICIIIQAKNQIQELFRDSYRYFLKVVLVQLFNRIFFKLGH